MLHRSTPSERPVNRDSNRSSGNGELRAGELGALCDLRTGEAGALCKLRTAEAGALWKGLLGLIVVLGVVLTGVAFLFGTVVSIGNVGVRKIAFGPGKGLGHRPLYPGYHWTIPGYSTVYQVPQTIQIINFDPDLEQHPDSFPALDVPTIDGTTIDVEVSVLFRFFDRPDVAAHHGGPAELITRVGATSVEWRKFLAQEVENKLKKELGALSTVDFYNPKLREAQVRLAEQAMRDSLAPFGIEIQGVLLRRYTYREEITQAIFKKNLQELETAFNKVAGDFAEAQRDVNKVDADGNVAIQNLDKQGIGEAQEIRSEGDLYRRQKVAEADLLTAKARADVDMMRSEVFAKVGSDIYIALQLAQLLASLKGGVVTNVDPYDFDAWVRRLAGPQISSPAQAGSEKVGG